ncbi:hypothetical protein D6C95_07192 [Aureobasidium pullulans]|nr:hypothetical protein D6C95_07192 [Aureobasidium pullulans]
MLRRTSQCLSRRQAQLLRPRYLTTTLSNRFATPTSGFAPTWDKIKENLKAPIDQFMPAVRPSYTVESPQSEESPDLLRSFTVLTSDPKATSLQELLDRIPHFNAGNESGLFTDFLLLVTPTYAASLRKQKNVIEKALTRIFPVKDLDQNLHNRLGGSSREAVRLVAAVVDRLPRPSDLSASAVGDIGSEGIAIRVVANENPIWKPELAHHDPRAALSDNKFRFLSFHLNDDATPASMRPIVQLPLANTIFQNGLSSTLIWRKYSVRSGGLGLKEIDEQLCDSHRVKLPRESASNETNNLTLTVPLVPLTSARSVVACMGNIIRRLSADSGLGPQEPTKEAILASHELEQSVTSYHKTRGLSPRAVSVWALVIPEKTFTGGLSMAAKVLGERNLTELWKVGSNHDTDPSQPNLLTLLQHGARLHKVLSGGGGWGKKAGLLSLDPDTGYGQHSAWEEITPAQLTDAENIGGLPPVPTDLQHVWSFEPQELPSIVNKGDYIQFYISPSASSEEAILQSKASTGSSEPISDVKTVEFGGIPSTVDNMPASEVSVTTVQAKTDLVQSYPNHFGALSETGLAMFFGLQSDKSSSARVHNATDAATKVDVPFGRLRSRSQKSENSSKAKQAEAGFAFSPTKPLQSSLSGCRQKLVAMKRRRRSFGSSSALYEIEQIAQSKPAGEIVWKNAARSSLSARNFKRTTERIPKTPNKTWTSGMINEARKVLKKAKAQAAPAKPRAEPPKPQSEPPKPSFTISKTTSVEDANIPPAQLYMSDLHGKRLQTWAKQTMQDIISPEAFQRWTQTNCIPKTPDDNWTQKDVRLAHTFKKRQWRLKKVLDKIRLQSGDTVTTATTTTKTSKRPSLSPSSSASAQPPIIRRKQKKSVAAKEVEKQPEHPTITALRIQAQSKARARMLKEAFRGLLSPSQQRSATSITPSSSSSAQGNPDFRITTPVLTRRIMNLITMHEPGSPRIRVYELLDIHRFPYNEELDTAIEKEKREQRKEELRKEFSSWRNAAEEVRGALEGKYGGEGKRQKWKQVVEDEFEEIRRVENAVAGFLTG